MRLNEPILKQLFNANGPAGLAHLTYTIRRGLSRGKRPSSRPIQFRTGVHLNVSSITPLMLIGFPNYYPLVSISWTVWA